MTIEEYAIKLVADGALDRAADDANESEEIADEDHQAAIDLAKRVARAIRTYPAEALALAQRVEEF